MRPKIVRRMNRNPADSDLTPNYDPRTVDGFGEEWNRFRQDELDADERAEVFAGYFRIFPWDSLPDNAEGADFGCGSGRWAMEVAAQVGTLHCFDLSRAALEVAKLNLKAFGNCKFHLASVDEIPLDDSSLDFAYCLGTLHHVPDTRAAMAKLVQKLKPGAPFLVYLYYSLENRPRWFRLIWGITDLARRVISRTPSRLCFLITDTVALVIYLPLARFSMVLEKLGLNVQHLPLCSYRRRSFYTMRTDALDRFGTSLEQRFTKQQIREMMEESGLERIEFSEEGPFWCAVGFQRAPEGAQL